MQLPPIGSRRGHRVPNDSRAVVGVDGNGYNTLADNGYGNGPNSHRGAKHDGVGHSYSFGNMDVAGYNNYSYYNYIAGAARDIGDGNYMTHAYRRDRDIHGDPASGHDRVNDGGQNSRGYKSGHHHHARVHHARQLEQSLQPI